MQRRVDLIEINEYANLSQRDSPHMLFEQMGFGQAPGEFNPARAAYLLEEFRRVVGGVFGGRVVDAVGSRKVIVTILILLAISSAVLP